MKKILFFSLFFSFAAFAEIKIPATMSRVDFDGTTLKGSYVTGGGCQDHMSKVELNVTKLADGKNIAEVKVFDVTEAPDYCEALLGVEVNVNLKEMFTVKAAELGISRWELELRLPLSVNN